MPASAGVNTKANLKSEVLQEIMMSLGLDYSRLSTKEKLIDEKLLANRNRIAHGQYLNVAYAEYLELHVEVLGMMQEIFDQIDERASRGAYRTARAIAP